MKGRDNTLNSLPFKLSREALSDEALRARLQELQSLPNARKAVEAELAHRQQKDQRHAAPRT